MTLSRTTAGLTSDIGEMLGLLHLGKELDNSTEGTRIVAPEVLTKKHNYPYRSPAEAFEVQFRVYPRMSSTGLLATRATPSATLPSKKRRIP